MKQEGIKYDTGKPRIFETIEDFQESLMEVAKVWTFGADKYGKHNWAYVDNAIDRYSNALLRHMLQGDTKDDESGLLHASHVAWNALARLYFIIQKNNQDNHNENPQQRQVTMTNDLEKQKMERLYKHFGFTSENIPLQKQVRQDIHDILIKLGASQVQSPDCVSINTQNGIHTIINYPFDITPNHWGAYEHSFCLKIKTDYKLEELEELVRHKVQALFEEG